MSSTPPPPLTKRFPRSPGPPLRQPIRSADDLGGRRGNGVSPDPGFDARADDEYAQGMQAVGVPRMVPSTHTRRLPTSSGQAADRGKDRAAVSTTSSMYSAHQSNRPRTCNSDGSSTPADALAEKQVERHGDPPMPGQGQACPAVRRPTRSRNSSARPGSTPLPTILPPSPESRTGPEGTHSSVTYHHPAGEGEESVRTMRQYARRCPARRTEPARMPAHDERTATGGCIVMSTTAIPTASESNRFREQCPDPGSSQRLYSSAR